ncbi:MAG: GNAT family N-acetyltransferase [Myxococcota bacterium]|nr:GNAT family N-acetyltransferase [Myxococcota bacterium]
MEIKILDRISAVSPEAWRTLLTPDDPPCLRYDFLAGLEEAGCATKAAGWTPRFVTAWEDDALVGAVPVYRKSHSQGEFIFDFAWADAAHRAGMPYYPKLVAGIPFTPVTCRKFLVPEHRQGEIWPALLEGCRQAAEREPATGIHWLFVTEAEAAFLSDNGILTRHTHQFQWINEGYPDFDSYLARFRSKRRAQIRRERRGVVEAGVTIRAVRGDEASSQDREAAWQFYRTTVDKFMWGRRYLNRAFFDGVFDTLGGDILLILADLNGKTIAGTFNLVGNDVFYGRYWGCTSEIPFLHFEVCMYTPVELAIQHGWRRVEAGAGGHHKLGRGFTPSIIRSGHELYLPGLTEALRPVLEAEKRGLEDAVVACHLSVFKKNRL